MPQEDCVDAQKPGFSIAAVRSAVMENSGSVLGTRPMAEVRRASPVLH